MALPLLALGAAAASGLGSYLNYRSQKKDRRPWYHKTKSAQALKRIGEEGVYSPTARSGMLGRQSGLLGGRANIRKTGLRGWLESRGMGKSIAGRGLVEGVDAGTTKSLSDYGRDIDIENELSKVRARRDYATQADAWNEQAREEKMGQKQQLYSGLGQALSMGVQGYMGSQRQQGFQMPENLANMSPQDVFQLAINKGIDPEQLMMIYYNARIANNGAGGR